MTTTKEQTMDDLTPPHWGARTDIEEQLEAARAELAEKDAEIADLRIRLTKMTRRRDQWCIRSEALATARATIAQQGEELARLRAMLIPKWFYADGYSSEDCHDSPDEVIEYLDFAPGRHVVNIDCAGPMPSIWCAIHVTHDKDADERFVFTEHETEAQARAALESPKQ